MGTRAGRPARARGFARCALLLTGAGLGGLLAGWAWSPMAGSEPPLLIPAAALFCGSATWLLRRGPATERAASPAAGGAEIALALARLPDVTAILDRQIAGAGAETERTALAGLEVLRELDAVTRATVDGVGAAQHGADVIARDGEGEVVALMAAVEDMRALLERRSAEIDAGRAIQAEMLAAATVMVEAVEAVRDRLLPPAAGIAAAREAEAAASACAALVEDMRRRLPRWRDAACPRPADAHDAGAETRLLQTIEREAEAIGAGFGCIAGAARRTLEEARSGADAIGRLMLRTLEGAQAQDLARQRLDQVRHGLRLLGAHAAALAAALRAGAAPPCIEAALLRPLEAAYVMQAQRRIHAGADGRDDRQPPSIELF